MGYPVDIKTANITTAGRLLQLRMDPARILGLSWTLYLQMLE